MLKRIKHLKQCGIFDNFSWPPTGLEEFSRYNLLYGWNGTGKTTLSRILRDLEHRQVPGKQIVELECVAETINSENFDSATIAIKVFNRDFVNDTVDGELQPISVFGKENKEKKSKLDSLIEQEKKVRGLLQPASKLKDTTESALKTFCKNSAKKIKDALGREGNSYASYDTRDFQRKAEQLLQLPDEKRQPIGEEEKQLLRKQTRAVLKEQLDEWDPEWPDHERLYAEVVSLRGRSAVSEAIASLSADAEVSAWVQTGMGLHATRKQEACLYCNQPLPRDRIQALERHFSDEVKNLQDDLDAKVAAVRALSKNLSQVEFPKKVEIAEHLTKEFDSIVLAARDQRDLHIASLSNLEGLLDDKRTHLFEAQSSPEHVAHPSTEACDKLAQLVESHNNAVQSFSDDLAAAERAYEDALVLDALEEYEEKRAAAASESKAYEDLCKEHQVVSKDVKTLRGQLVSHQIPATRLTADLKQYLGHEELKIESKKEGYAITRNGEKATHLSDGERTAIAVLYFLRTFDDEGVDLEETVVVFDDPVSSLDANSLYNAFAFIKNRTQSAKQLLVLTHNFAFFRLMRKWFEFLKKQDIRFFMIHTEYVDNKRTSKLGPVDDLLVQYQSDYHYLFSCVHRIAGTSATLTLAECLPIPNIARRVLEAFLAFKVPGKGNLNSKLRKVDADEVRRSRIDRFVNIHSHLDAVGDYDEDMTCLTSAPAILQDILDVIKEADVSHYDGMVSCVGSS